MNDTFVKSDRIQYVHDLNDLALRISDPGAIQHLEAVCLDELPEEWRAVVYLGQGKRY